MNCVTSLNIVKGCLVTYQVLEDMMVRDKHKEIVKKVVFNMENHYLSCGCLLFEFRDILCRHVLSVCAHEMIEKVSEKYVLSRWKKNIKRKHSYIKSCYSAVEMKPQIERFNKLCKHFYNVAGVAAESEVATKTLHETLHQWNFNLPTMDDITGIHKESLNVDSNANTGLKGSTESRTNVE
ncbi:protein FAR-RED IMPAIRED RESPONSE [Trifolium repens]|nr:protein FAR-RED IMPAIRED RESPONSE [Trifolium repens]